VSRVAVIGANGFVGSRLVEQWHLEGLADVVPIVRRPEAAVGALRFGLPCRIADAMDERALGAALDGCGAVVHAGAGGEEFVRGSVSSVVRAAERAGVGQIVYLSSMAVHGWDAPPGTDESSPLSHRHAIAYNAWKVHAEHGLSGLCRERGIRAVILRPGIVYGPRSQWVERFARALLDGRAYVVGGGRGVCNAVYVDNLAFASELWVARPGRCAFEVVYSLTRFRRVEIPYGILQAALGTSDRDNFQATRLLRDRHRVDAVYDLVQRSLL